MALSSHNGYLDGTGESMYAAHADHTHDADYAPKDHNHDDKYAPIDEAYAIDEGCSPVQVKVATIATTDWSEDSATVSVTGTFVGAFCADSTISVGSVGESVVTFTASETPSDDVTVSIFSIPSQPDAEEGADET